MLPAKRCNSHQHANVVQQQPHGAGRSGASPVWPSPLCTRRHGSCRNRGAHAQAGLVAASSTAHGLAGTAHTGSWGCSRSWPAGHRTAVVTAASGGAAVASAVGTVGGGGRGGVSPSVLKLAEGLPIRECLADVVLGLDRSSGLVLQAPPGAGKTTVVPLALLEHSPEYLEGGQKILVLEPRRVAAKGAARRMASSLGQSVGGTVGYRVRLDTRVGPSTRIEVVTEGILLRRMQHDPELQGVGAVVFDEFHERNLDSDTALALCLDLQRLARPDLRLVVMSATLGGGLGDRVRALMAEAQGLEGQLEGEVEEQQGQQGGVPLVLSEGRSYPVRTVYTGRPGTGRGELEEAAVEAVGRALKDGGSSSTGGGGDVLVFLPGVGEIRAVERLLEERGVARRNGARVLTLYGDMAPDEQDEVLRPNRRGTGGPRRVILSTPIAESSVTIDGVTAVVDSGLRRVPYYDASTAINRLVTVRISQASAEQRRGRAGRTAPGTCYRLWDERDDAALPAVSEPEICTADLAPLALDLALWGSPDGGGLPWLDPPPQDQLEAGLELLKELGAIDPATCRPTRHGRLLGRLAVHPRWGHAVLRGAALGAAELAAVVACALGGERDVLRGDGAAGRSADFMLRLEALARDDVALDRASARRILQGAKSMAATVTAAAASAAAAEQQQQKGSKGSQGQGQAKLGGGGVEEEEDRRALAAMEAMGVAAEAAEAGAASGSEGDADGDGDGSASAAAGGPSGKATAAAAPRAAVPFDAAWRSQLSRPGLVGALVAAAYPDRIAERKDRSNRRAAYTLSTGQVVRLPGDSDPLADFDYVAVADIGGVGPAAAWRRDGGGNDTVRAAAGLSRDAIERYLKDMVQEREVVFWASSSKAVLARRQLRLGCLVLKEQTIPTPTDNPAVHAALLKGFREMGGIRGVELSRDMEAWRQRVVWLRGKALELASANGNGSGKGSSNGGGGGGGGSVAARLAALPDLSDAGLLATAGTWLVPHLSGVRTKGDILKLPWGNILKSMVPWELQQLVESEAPSHLQLPTGTRALVDYGRDPPAVRAKLQELFGLAEAPRLAGGRIPLTLELLNPAGRPLAVTSDLASFWTTSYPSVRKEMRGEYPRHIWPEDPVQAEATRLSKRKFEEQQRAAEAAAAAAGGAGGGSGGGKAGSGGKGAGGGKQQSGGGKKKR